MACPTACAVELARGDDDRSGSEMASTMWARTKRGVA